MPIDQGQFLSKQQQRALSMKRFYPRIWISFFLKTIPRRHSHPESRLAIILVKELFDFQTPEFMNYCDKFERVPVVRRIFTFPFFRLELNYGSLRD
tara:strand:- start:79316 stop:79603 length:288 start_codon:yes stop_codon:yes gene_type:complete